MNLTMTYYKNFWKCHNVPPSTTIIKVKLKNKEKLGGWRCFYFDSVTPGPQASRVHIKSGVNCEKFFSAWITVKQIVGSPLTFCKPLFWDILFNLQNSPVSYLTKNWKHLTTEWEREQARIGLQIPRLAS
jgi:hypothetical protein